jgi:ribonuclease HI
MARSSQIQPEYVMFFDGCSKSNPGASGAGALILKNGVEIWSGCEFVGEKKTNNFAEYSGLLLGLRAAMEILEKEAGGGDLREMTLAVYGDSLLVINQMRGIWKVKSLNLATLYNEAREMVNKFRKVSFAWIPREDNSRADELSNQGCQQLTENIYE